MWIEIFSWSSFSDNTASHPSRVCGLKLYFLRSVLYFSRKSHPSRVCGLKSLTFVNESSGSSVAPFAGVWIEIVMQSGYRYPNPQSHPSRVCGLKLIQLDIQRVAPESHPSRVCGLKSLDVLLRHSPELVAPFAGVWIEMFPSVTTHARA